MAADQPRAIRKVSVNELIAKSPEFARAFREFRNTYQEERARIESGIKSIKGLRLNRLEQAGAKPEMVLRVLAMEVYGSSWPRKVRRIKQSQKMLAARLREDAERVERMYRDDASYPDLYTTILPGARDGLVVPASERVPHLFIQEMRARADELDTFAREFGRFLKKESPKLERQYVVALLKYVHHSTGNVRRHLVLLAAMLMDIYVKYGIRKSVSPESLAKIFERYAKSRRQSTDKTPT